MAQINTRIVLRNDSLTNWEANSQVVLLKGEVGVAYNDDGSARIKLGDGVRTWAEIDWFGGDTTTITNVTETIVQELIGAPANPESGEEATGIYKDIEDLESALGVPADEEAGTEATGLYKDVEDLQAALGTPADKEAGTEATGVYKELADIVNDKFSEVTDNGKIDTVIELIDYVESHGAATEQIVHDLTELQALVGSTPIPDQIVDVLTQKNILGKEDNDQLYQNVKFEITSLPKGAVVDYKDSEIRVMCPTNTIWQKQNVGATGNANMYYMGFKAYAPAGAVSFKEGDHGVIIDEMFTFDNAFAGTDKYGRNYSICWLALASYNETSGLWTYLGSTSNVSKFLGWDYVVEWYDADGMMISADSIRINLSNESCHNSPVPYYMGNVIKEISVNGALVDVVNNRAEITINNIVKDSDEIIVNKDGSLRIVQLDASKLVTGDTTLVLNGGSAAM